MYSRNSLQQTMKQKTFIVSSKLECSLKVIIGGLKPPPRRHPPPLDQTFLKSEDFTKFFVGGPPKMVKRPFLLKKNATCKRIFTVFVHWTDCTLSLYDTVCNKTLKRISPVSVHFLIASLLHC